MGKYFNKNEEYKDKVKKDMAEKIKSGRNIPLPRLISSVNSEVTHPTDNKPEYMNNPDYVHDWLKMGK